MDLRKFLEQEVKDFLDKKTKEESLEKINKKEASRAHTSGKPSAEEKIDVALSEHNPLLARHHASEIADPHKQEDAQKKISSWEDSQGIEQAVIRTKKAIDDQELKISLKEYAQTKSLYDSLSISEKKEWFDKINALYQEVQSLSESQKPSFEHIKETSQKIIDALDQGDIHSAEQLLMDGKHQLAQVPADFTKQRQLLENIFSQLSSRVLFVKQHPDPHSFKEGVEHRYKEGVKLLKDGKSDEAQKAFAEVLETDNTFLPARIRLELLGGVL